MGGTSRKKSMDTIRMTVDDLSDVVNNRDRYREALLASTDDNPGPSLYVWQTLGSGGGERRGKGEGSCWLPSV